MFCLLVQMSFSYHSQIVNLEFTGFHLEDHNNDWMRVYDGSSTSARLIGEYCGTTSPGPITSSRRYLYLNFHSDHSEHYQGAQFQWQAQRKLFGVHFLSLPQMHWPGETFNRDR